MGPETDTVEPVLAGYLPACLAGWLAGMYGESSEPILMQIS